MKQATCHECRHYDLGQCFRFPPMMVAFPNDNQHPVIYFQRLVSHLSGLIIMLAENSMTILYNAHTDGDQYRITKFNDGEVESSYLCSTDECQCPAGQRSSCRHRLMLPLFIARNAVNSFWFLDFERKGWVSNEPAELQIAHEITLPDDATPDEVAEAFSGLLHSERSELGSQEPPLITTERLTPLPGKYIIEYNPTKPWRRI